VDTAFFIRNAPAGRYRAVLWLGLAPLAALAALGLKLASGPFFDQASLVLPLIVVCAMAALGGMFCGIVTGVLCAALFGFFVFRTHAAGLSLAFVIVSMVVSWIVARIKKTSAQLKTKERQLTELLENASVGISWLDREGAILWTNAATLKLLGYAPGEFVQHRLCEFSPDPLDSILESFRAGRNFDRRELHLRAADGAIKTVLMDASVLCDDAGQFLHARCFTHDITERKAAERALHQSEAKFRTLFEKSLDAIGVSRRGVHVFANPAYLNLFGYEHPDQILGRPVIDLLAPSSRSEVAARIERRARGETVPTQYEARGLRADGTEFDFEVNVSLFELDGAQHTLVILRDITERKEHQRQLLARARQQEIVAAIGQKAVAGSLTSLFQHAAAMIRQTLDVDTAGIFQVLPGGREMILSAGDGWSQNVVGAATCDATLRSYPGYVLSAKGPVVAKKLGADQRFAALPLLANKACALASSIHIGDRLYGVLGVFHRAPRSFSDNDAHFIQAASYVLAAAIERQKADAGLRERELFLRTVIDANPNIILVKDRNGVILLANHALANTYGLNIKEIVGLSHLELHRRLGMNQDEVLQWLADDREVIDEQKPVSLVESFTHRDGTLHWYSARKLPLTLADNRPCVLIISVDISEQKSAEERIRRLNTELEVRVTERTAALAQANKELEAFSYSISHDLRSPLRAIDGFTLIIREDHGPTLPPEVLRLLDLVSGNAAKMAQLIDDLLRFARAARGDIETLPVDMGALAQSVIHDMEVLEPPTPKPSDPVPRRPYQIVLGDLPDAVGDPAMLRQVFVNLVSNAIKFTRPAKHRSARAHSADAEPESRQAGIGANAQIEIGASGDANENTYYVRDNGVGFDAKYSHKLFQVFQRLHRTEDYDGTGVGLAIVQRIIQRHGGRVWADGKPNEGATFYFTLPRATSGKNTK
jgi:PAS domain S-box-containing protein